MNKSLELLRSPSETKDSAEFFCAGLGILGQEATQWQATQGEPVNTHCLRCVLRGCLNNDKLCVQGYRACLLGLFFLSMYLMIMMMQPGRQPGQLELPGQSQPMPPEKNG